ncbi:Ig-like domain-containing protein, partial [Nibrella viscosa]
MLRLALWLGLLLTSWIGYSQQLSPNTVNYRVTYDATSNRYTAFVIPNYNVPNANNTGTTERGGTAQYTLKVPAQFVVQDIQDIRGTWEKNPLKLGPGQPNQDFSGTGLDPAFAYYVIGKSPSETDYGSFQSGTPVALFSFAGNGCFGPISPLPPTDPFIAAADQRFSLNVGNSFYSRSGQPAGGNVVPLEQFVNITGPAANCLPGVVATPDNATTTAGTLVVIPILTNDFFNGGPASTTNVTASITGPPASGTAVVNPNGTVNFTPAPGFSGPVSFTYTICSIATPVQCASAVVNVTVVPVTPPTSTVANPDNATTTAGTAVNIPILANDTRNGGPASTTNVTPTITGAPANGTAVVNANGTVTFTPAPGFSGPVSFTYTICSIATPVQCASAVVSVTVVPVTPPTSTVANPDNATTTAGTAVNIPILANDTRNGGPAST